MLKFFVVGQPVTNTFTHPPSPFPPHHHKKASYGPVPKSHLFQAGILAEAISMTFWHVVSTGYLYVLFLWAIVVSDFHPLKICKNLDLPLSTITFTVNSHADNHFYRYISLSQILYSMKSVFLLKYMLRFFIFKLILMWLLFFQIKNSPQKKYFVEKWFFSVDYVKIIELHVVHKWRHMESE